jgi:pimeloyl-ACP methyl ester carboxylesterase
MVLASAARQHPHKILTAQTLSGGSVQVWGENTYYQAAGVAEDRPTILFLHESGGSAATWQGQLVGLAQYARCLVVDLPGHGRSEGVGYASVSEYRAALEAFLDALAIRWPVVVAGVCLGAAIAVDLARHAPERVSGLILAGLSEGGRACEQVRRLTARGELAEEFVHALFGRIGTCRHLSSRLQQWRLTSPVVRHGDLMAMSAYPLRQGLKRVQHPVLVVAGADDQIATPAAIAELAGEVAGCRTAILPGAGCLSMLEQPGQFNQVVVDFLADLDPVAPIELNHIGGYRRRF